MCIRDRYDPYPKRKFIQKLNDNNFETSFATDHNNEIADLNDVHDANGKVDMDSWDGTKIVMQSDKSKYPVSRIKNNAGLYSCNNCTKQFSSSTNLKTHVESIHDGIRYSCKQCDYKATTKGDLKKHTQSVHDKITYPCLQCDYKATQTSSLKTHVKKQHN